MKQLFCLLLISLPALRPAASQTTAPLMTDRAAARFLDQATWGPTPQAIANLQNTGMTPWLEQQFAAKMTDLPDQAILQADGKSNNNLAPVQAAFIRIW